MHDIIERHQNIALQLSGGKDSLACLFLMKPYLDKITVYWCNTGAAYPETVDLMEQIRSWVPNFVEIEGQQPAVIREFGIPTDILPASRTPMGVAATGNEAHTMQDRYSCCLRSFMLPMHERMVSDGITLIIRGQKNSDKLKGPLRSGQVDGGIEYLFPIEDWTSEQVMAYLREQKAPIPRFYEVLDSAPDCVTCSAYWEEGAVKYLKRYHYQQYQEVQHRLAIISEAVSDHIANFNVEVNT
jgi:phosphoadenosine phosphosulfate reductase